MAFIRSESTGMPLADHGIEQFLCNIYALLEVQGVRKGSQPRCTTPEVSSGSIIYLCTRRFITTATAEYRRAPCMRTQMSKSGYVLPTRRKEIRLCGVPDRP